jgi:hypothetical protein
MKGKAARRSPGEVSPSQKTQQVPGMIEDLGAKECQADYLKVILLLGTCQASLYFTKVDWEVRFFKSVVSDFWF